MEQSVHFPLFGGIGFEYLYITAPRDRYSLMCKMRTYETEKITSFDAVISGSGRPISDTSTTDVLKYLYISFNFITPWLKYL